jgi:NAD(P)H-flavin reductase
VIASLAVIFFDRIVRLLRTALIHFNLKSSTQGIGFRSVTATVEAHVDADGERVLVLRLISRAHCKPGQHCFLTFPSLSIFQGHPFTPALVIPSESNPGMYEHTYLIVAMSGETKRLADLNVSEIPVILTGPYGNEVLDSGAENFLFIAGGTGVSFTLPLLKKAVSSTPKLLSFIWIIRRGTNTAWLENELSSVREEAEKLNLQLQIQIHITRESADSETTSLDGEKKELGVVVRSKTGSLVDGAAQGRPGIDGLVKEFIEKAVDGGRCQVLASGPEGMETDIRRAVAVVNRPGDVWQGKEERDVSIYWDGRYH